MEPIGPDVAKELARGGQAAAGAELAAAWPRAVGEGIARHAWPTRLGRDGTLHVAAESATWAFELAHLAPDLLARLRETLPGTAPTALRFAVGPLPAPATPPPAEVRAPIRASPEANAEAAELTSAIADEGLRELVRRTAALSLSGSASDR